MGEWFWNRGIDTHLWTMLKASETIKDKISEPIAINSVLGRIIFWDYWKCTVFRMIKICNTFSRVTCAGRTKVFLKTFVKIIFIDNLLWLTGFSELKVSLKSSIYVELIKALSFTKKQCIFLYNLVAV